MKNKIKQFAVPLPDEILVCILPDFYTYNFNENFRVYRIYSRQFEVENKDWVTNFALLVVHCKLFKGRY